MLSRAFLAGFGALLVTSLAAQAGETPWVRTQGADVRLLSGAVVDGKLEAGVEIRLAPGWKTYWRYPGDSGVPPRFDWTGSRNMRTADVAYPAPRRFSDGASGHSIGYKGGSVIFPVTVTLEAPDKATRLDLALDFAVCDTLCVPAQAQMSLDVQAGAREANVALAAARAKLPTPAPIGQAGLGVISFAVDRAANPPVLEVVATTRSDKPDLFAEGPTDAWALPLPARQSLGDGRTRFTLPLDGMPTAARWQGATLSLTLVDGADAVVTTVPLPTD